MLEAKSTRSSALALRGFGLDEMWFQRSLKVEGVWAAWESATAGSRDLTKHHFLPLIGKTTNRAFILENLPYLNSISFLLFYIGSKWKPREFKLEKLTLNRTTKVFGEGDEIDLMKTKCKNEVNRCAFKGKTVFSFFLFYFYFIIFIYFFIFSSCIKMVIAVRSQSRWTVSQSRCALLLVNILFFIH